LLDKFFLESIILENKNYKDLKKAGNKNPFNQNRIIICSYQFARAKADFMQLISWDLAVIDEAASFRGHIEYLIDECIAPSFITRRGRLRMIGTPSADFTSYFYKAFHELNEYTRHRWTTVDNTSIPDVRGYLEKLRKKKGWTENNPVYLREYEGQFVRTEENLVYQYNPLRNQCSRGEVDALRSVRYVLGVDLGWNDANALVVLAYNPEISRNLYVVAQYKKSGQLIAELGEKIKELDNLYHFEQMVCDGGGLGRSIIEELNTRYYLRLVPAEKTSKMGYISLLNSDLEQGYLKIVDEEVGLGEEWLNLQWKDDSRKTEDPKCDNHLSDAALYAWRAAYAYAFEKKDVRAEEKRLMEKHKAEWADEDDGKRGDGFDDWRDW
jgi:hypothetical protein